MLFGPDLVNVLMRSSLLILQILQLISVPLSGEIQEGWKFCFNSSLPFSEIKLLSG